MSRAAPLTSDALAVLNASHSLPLVAKLSVKFAANVTTWGARRRTRLALETLEDWQLRDVGLTPVAAHREARKVFWKT